MKDLRSRLTQGDPVRLEGELSGTESRRLREQILAAKPVPKSAHSRIAYPIAAMLLFVAVGSGWLVRTSVPEAALGPTESRPRQLQFSTSGGTRIIWTFNDNFELR
jgi:hypothetical protein